MKAPDNQNTVGVPLADQGAIEASERGEFDKQGRLTPGGQCRGLTKPQGDYERLMAALYDRAKRRPQLEKQFLECSVFFQSIGFTDLAHQIREGIRDGRKETGDKVVNFRGDVVGILCDNHFYFHPCPHCQKKTKGLTS